MKNTKPVKVHFCGEATADIREGFKPGRWPTQKPNSVDEAHVTNVLQFLNGAQRIAFMNELHAAMKTGAQVTIIVPHAQSAQSWMDPKTVGPPFSEQSFLFFNAEWRKNNKIPKSYGIECDFDFGYGFAFQGAWPQKNEEARNFALVNYNNVAAFVQLVMTKR